MKPKQKLFIIGCGNVGGFIANNLDEFGSDLYTIEGFLDDDNSKIGKEFFGYKVIGNIECIGGLAEEVAVVICVSNPKFRMQIVERLSLFPNINYPSFICKNVWLSSKVSIGKGVIIYPGVAINYNTTVEDFSILNMNCAIGHDCVISSCSTLAPGVALAGFTFLEEGAEMCINSATVQGSRIGAYSKVGGMGMVTCDIPAYCTAVGIPARPIKFHQQQVQEK